MSLALGGCLKAPPVAYGLTEDTGGHIAYVLGAARALSELDGVEAVEVVTRLFEEPALGPEYARAVEDLSPTLRIVRIDSGNRAYLAKEALAQDRPAFTAELCRYLERQPQLPDVIHAHFADAAEVAQAVRERFGIPFVYTAHSLGRDKLKTGLGGDLLAARVLEEERAIGAADAIVASSRDECERQLPDYRSAAPGRIFRLRPGVDAVPSTEVDRDAAKALIAPFLRDPCRRMVLAIARPVHKKNLVALVEAFASSPSLRARANLVILAGLREGLADGGEEQRAVLHGIVDAIDRHDLHGQVAFPRRHTQAEVAGLYDLARESGGVFVNPALNEPYGLTLVEAAMHGLPVVATNCGGPQDIVGEIEHGLLVDPRSPAAIARAIEDVIATPARWRAFSANARRNAPAMSWDAYAAGFATLTKRLTDRTVALRLATPARLLLSDIDNTLTGCPDGALRLATYLRRHAATTAFGVATGRSLTEARRLLLEWSLPEPDVIVSSVGTEIYWRDGRDYRRDEDFRQAIENAWRPEAAGAALAAIPGLAPQADIDQRPFKLSYFADGPDVAAAVERALERNGIEARVVYSHGRLLDVLPPNAGKGAAMRHVTRVLGLPCERVIAAGDSGNDADMLAACPGAVVVANHDPDLARIAELQHVYRASRAHAAGVLEGLLWHARRGSAKRVLDAAA
ncbi:HAD-IIB family hydrolase [Tsuneonella amylolytica]|uniref:HAD-IIB family hydrolase n=1 Tax=Tsuneonella amylolytica TaxID=2338327 RepID=UPI0013C3FDFF|nr:HAD-IIB family hydrolase [Tsuneonella amylolytica]